MTRGMKQLWQERERFMKYERGWAELERNKVDVELDEEVEMEDTGTLDNHRKEKQSRILDSETKRPLKTVEDFYVSVIENGRGQRTDHI